MPTVTPRGITLLDLITRVPPAATELIPDDIAGFLQLFTIYDLSDQSSANFYVHRGVARSLSDLAMRLPAGFDLELPGVTEGIRFEYAAARQAVSAPPNALEAVPLAWTLDLLFDRIVVPLPFVTAAVRGVAAEGFVGPLAADPDRERVHVWVDAVLRFANGPTGITVALADQADPFVPNAPSGAVLRGGFEPRHMMFGNTGFGLSVGDLLIDASTTYSPQQILARGQDAAWTGLDVPEATLYLPKDLPFVGDVTMGVRDLLLGFAPENGIQLEAFVQLGEPGRLDPGDGGQPPELRVDFYQEVDGTVVDLDTPTGPAMSREVTLHENTDGSGSVFAQLHPADGEGMWLLPGTGGWTRANDTGWFVVRPGNTRDKLRYRDILRDEEDPSREVLGPEITWRFVKPAPANEWDKFPPRITATIGGDAWENVTHISGSAAELLEIVLEAGEPLPSASADRSAALAAITWEYRRGNQTITEQGGSFEIGEPWTTGTHEVILTDGLGRRRRLEIEILPDSDRIIVGCANVAGQSDPGPRMVQGASESAATPAAVIATHDLAEFHQRGERVPGAEAATISGGTLAAPPGSLAEVSLLDAGEPPEHHVLSLIRVRMDFDATTACGMRSIYPDTFETSDGTVTDPWGPPDPYPPFVNGNPDSGNRPDSYTGFLSEAEAVAAIRSWAREALAADPSAAFVLVGRACDIGSAAYNADLGQRRAERGLELLTSSAWPDPVDASAVAHVRGEQIAISNPGELPADPTSTVVALDGRHLADRTKQQFRIVDDFGSQLGAWGDDEDIPERLEARCVELYAVVPNPVQSGVADDEAMDPRRRRTLVPGPDLWSAEAEPAKERSVSYALQLLTKWDSPTWVDSQDSMPTLVQLTLAWQNENLAVPGLQGQVKAVGPDGGETEEWIFIFRFAKDPRSRQLTLTASLDNPGSDDGIFQIVDAAEESISPANLLAAIAGLGPALSLGTTSPGGGPGLPLGIIVPTALALLPGVIDNGRVTVFRLELEYSSPSGDFSSQAGARYRILADYTASFDVNAFLQGRGIEIRYLRAGIEWDNDPSLVGLARLSLVYDEAAMTAMEISNPGVWEMPAPLAKLLAVTAIRMGGGSIWIEADIALARDLGPVRLTSATVRLTFDAGAVTFSLRGLTAEVNIPAVVTGSGAVQISEQTDGSTSVSAAVDLQILPAGLRVIAAFLYAEPMTHLEVEVRFASPIPLLGTGLGLFGLAGRFVSNGVRALPDEPDPVARELKWYELPVLSKYAAESGQVALGLGAMLGTLPDKGFSFNLDSMIAVGLPDPSVVLTVAGSFMKLPAGAQEDATRSPSSASLLGIVAIDSSGVAVAIRGSYEIPYYIRVEVPIAGWFPFADSSVGGYLRIGSDGFAGRPDDPVTVTLYPDILDVRAWAFLMIEERELRNLGGLGDEGFDFTGYAIGFGCGFDFDWGGRTVGLEASAALLVGLGTKPFLLMGAALVKGDLWLGPAGVSVDGALILELLDNDGIQWSINGEFCGTIDLLVEISGCVAISIGSPVPLPTPEQLPLVSGVTLTDPLSRVIAEAVSSGTPGPANTAWVDCRPTIHFDHGVLNELDDGSLKPTPSGGWGADWSGTNRVKYLYRLRAVELLDGDGNPVEGAEDFPATWWMPAFRSALPAEGDAPASSHEGWDLALLAWDPAPWARSMTGGGSGTAGDPAEVIENLCDPLPEASECCVFGGAGRRRTPARVRFPGSFDGPLPWPSVAALDAVEATMDLDQSNSIAFLEALGYTYQPGAAGPLPGNWTDPDHGSQVSDAWWLATFQGPPDKLIAAGCECSYTEDVHDPDLVLAIGVSLDFLGDMGQSCHRFTTVGDPPLDTGSALPPTFEHFPEDAQWPSQPVTFTCTSASLVDMWPAGAPDGDPEIGWYGTLRIDLLRNANPPAEGKVGLEASWVQANVIPLGIERIQLRAFDRDGNLIASVTTPDGGSNQEHELQILGEGIAAVELSGAGLGGVINLLNTLCFHYQAALDPRVYPLPFVALLGLYAEILAPTVHGLRDAGEAAWQPQRAGLLWNEDRVVALIRYEPDEADAGPWTGLRIDASYGLEVGVVSSCFKTASAVEGQQAAEAAQEELLDTWNSSWNAPESEQVVLLEAGREYGVRIRYDRAIWQSEGTGNPPSSSSLDWDDPPESISVDLDVTQTFSFKTAAHADLPDDKLLQFDAQESFDPRAVARYLIGTDPGTSDGHHFLDDKLLVHFSVRWIEMLLLRHGFQLVLDVVRTDAQPGKILTYDERKADSTVQWGGFTTTVNNSTADARLAVAALLAPCVDGPRQEGITACVEADLAPRARYDLLVKAVPTFGEESVIARVNFGTSRYRDPGEMLTAMGFDPLSAGPNTSYPVEHLTVGTAPMDVRLGDDALLDAALAGLGMDPWPLATSPGAVAVWVQDGAWKLAAVLIDSDEAIERAPRLEDILDDSPLPYPVSADLDLAMSDAPLAAVISPDSSAPVDYVEAPARLGVDRARLDGHDLIPRRSNVSGTRLLLVPDAPIEVTDTSDPVLQLTLLSRGTTVTGHRYLTAIPRLVAQEMV